MTFETANQGDRVQISLKEGTTTLGHIVLVRVDETLYNAAHTRVFPEFEGRGFGKQLVRAAVLWARERRVSLQATCSYANAVLHRTPEWHDVFSDQAP